MSNDLLLRDVRPMGGAAVDVLIRAGRIAEIGSGHRRPGHAGRGGAGGHPAAGPGRGAHPSRQEPPGPALAAQLGRPHDPGHDRQRAQAEARDRHGAGPAVGTPGRAVDRQRLDPHPQPCRRRHQARHVGHRGGDGDPRALPRLDRHRARRLPAVRHAQAPRHGRADGGGAAPGRRGRGRHRPLHDGPGSEGPCRHGVRPRPDLRPPGRHPSARAERARHVLDGPDRRPHQGARHGAARSRSATPSASA